MVRAPSVSSYLTRLALINMFLVQTDVDYLGKLLLQATWSAIFLWQRSSQRRLNLPTAGWAHLQ